MGIADSVLKDVYPNRDPNTMFVVAPNEPPAAKATGADDIPDKAIKLAAGQI